MQLHDLARRLAAMALAAVDPERLVRDELARRGQPFTLRFDAVLAVGKAAAGLARGTSSALLDPGWEQNTGGHPFPDRQSVAAGERVERWLAALAPGQSLLALISGGGSACLELPPAGLDLEDLVATQRALLASGLPIQAVNAVRKHLSRLKGGGALRATPARVLALLLSDVPGDDVDAIASGPFAADPTTYADALTALASLAVPAAVRRHLEAGARGEIAETLKPGEAAQARLETVVIGGAHTAAAAVVAEARRRGIPAVAGDLVGEAATAARELVARGRAHREETVVLVLAGETAVELGASPGSTGTGGRNQELALAAARELADAPRGGELVLTLATDGEDGATRAAGGVVDAGSWEAIRRAGVDPREALARHDSHRALAAVPATLLETGATGTNVGDLAIYLRVAEKAGFVVG
jgi:glycerate 2-kinase